jgi:uncharacterized protein (TIGR02600 family)
MPDPLAKPNRPKPNALEGAALIIVLSCLVLLAALAIGLLNRVEADRANASAYRGSTQTRNLAEYAINVVMAQISAATKSDPTLAWASQPGAIRTYSSSGSALQNIYKLYSSPNMVVTAFPSADINLTGWNNNTALFTDLNAPVISGSGVTARTNYPILDPAATNSVQGFAISGAPNTTTIQPAPMPVNWLYVLEDGTLVPPTTAAGNNTVTVTSATAANPIVGRIAFWTDDDTSKININTASGAPWNYTNTTVTTTWGASMTTRTPANYWDTPIIGSSQDINLALAQPWAAEYQRYPGHPASVSLSAAFTNLSTNDIMAIAPRLTYQNNNTNVGSQWGSFVTENSPNTNRWATLTMVNPGIDQAFRIPDDASRLYANVDELLFNTNRSATGTNPVTPQQLERARFFLTASSRAPDVTLFNTPRIVFWPITFTPGNTNKLTPYDRLIAFCGTVGANTNYASANSYYFTRWSPLSATADYDANFRLLAYLRRMTTSSVPGFGGSSGILGKFGATEAEQITTQIFDYIRCINVNDMSMATSATNTTNQYVYASGHAGVMPTRGASDTRGFGRFPTISKVGIVFWFNNYFRTVVTNSFTNAGVVNTQTNTNTNVSLCARLIMEPFYASHGHPSPVTSQTHRVRVDGLLNLQWGVTTNTNILTTNTVTGLVSTNNTNLFIWTNIFPNNTALFTNTSSGRPHGGRVAFEAITTNGFIGTSPTNTNPLTTNLFPLVGPATLFFNTSTTNVVTNAVNTNQTVAYTNSTFGFSGGTLTFTITDNAGTTTHQVINVNLPPIPSLPVPLDTYTTNWVSTPTVPQTTVSFNGPGAWTSGNLPWVNALNPSMGSTNLGRTIQQSNHRFRPEDVVRAVGVAHGDFRLIAANPSVGTNSYATIDGGTNVNAYYSSDPNQRIAHNFVGEYPYSTIGGRFPHANYYISTNTTFTAGLTNSVTSEFGPLTNSSSPPINWTTNGLYTRINGDSVRPTTTAVTGDFDNGYGAAGDGPYIGFADEGNARIFQFRYTGEANTSFAVPYLDGSGALLPVGAGFFSPNRLVPSAGIMGSLPTGVFSQIPWQTLLFRPAALTSPTHPGLNNPPDYLLLDLFNMPVVEPYAISEPLSTAGRVNMNYQILPFTYIKRSTAVQAALHTELLTAIPNARMSDQGRKSGGPGTSAATRDSRNSRWPLNLNTNTGTLRGFEDRFASNDIFRSAAEICSIPLVPTNSTWSAVNGGTFWPNYSLTGDNSKERPYARIYPKLTTKSNTYTVHYRVEVLKKSPNSTSQNTWADGTDKVISTYRGSTTIERYVNPRDPGLPDYASITTLPPRREENPLPNFYKFRILGERQFNP